ncbi:VOC family protein [Natronoglycomyces albus]|uniref:VOC family protein n=1 Tax=Natronoglycomyces albus TaxID=2811108 RepID=A0A895XKA7_9ACTN|nr:VOC family protein [Natronoglycomyces albus]QSB05477.1 VOC family protein [Natronoglycomyces albus]
MIGVSKIGLNVKDQDAAKEFWTKTMGFTEILDTPMGDAPGAPRWIEVRSPDDAVELTLFTPQFREDQIGSLANLVFECEDVEATVADLKERGVEIVDEPKIEFWGGWWASFKDPEGNHYGLTKREAR